MKASILIQLLTPKERRQLEKTVIKSHKRLGVQKLYQQLKKKPVPEKEALHRAVFDLPYTPTGDAKLRNELRLLTQAIEGFLVQQQQAAPPLNSYAARWALLQLYQERQAVALLEQQWNRLYKTAVDQKEYGQQVELIQFWFDYQRTHVEPSLELFESLKVWNQKAQIAALAQFEETQARLKVNAAFLERNCMVFASDYTPQLPEPLHERRASLPNESILEYLEMVAQSFLQIAGEQRIELLQQSFELLPELRPYPRYQDLVQRAMLGKASIALEYFLKKDYQQADRYYQEALPELDHLAQAQKAAVYFNYLNNLVCLERYQEVLAYCEKEGKALFAGQRFEHRVHYSLAWSHIFLGNYEAALDQLLSQDIQEHAQNDLVYGRILLSILYSMRGDADLAERELLNLRQKHYYSPFNEAALSQVTHMFHRLVQYNISPPSDKRTKVVQQLKRDMEAFYEANATTSSTLLHRWFTQITNNLLK